MDSQVSAPAVPGGRRETPRDKPRRGRIKCVVWDLDETLWDGVLLEDGEVALRPAVVELIEELDARGILQSVASKNDHDAAMERLAAFGLADYFLHPRIGWGPKSDSVAAIATALNIGVDSLAFVDDQEFELEEVAFRHPQALCVAAAEMGQAVFGWEEFRPRFITDESRNRRSMYRSAIERDQAEEEAKTTGEDFLATLGMVFTIGDAAEEDLRRAEELTVRTNQLNSTGQTYSYDELKELCASPDHRLLVADLEDRFGQYGKIGLALVETRGPVWKLKLLLMSCRVMSRGVGAVLLNHVMTLARDHGAALRAEFVETGRNRMMFVTYRFAGFQEVGKNGDATLLEADLTRVQPAPDYLVVTPPGT
ncbi:HAD-IIIC family phosphatase [Streptomyces acidiscabies]|uniref:FkbH n=1 Tax=Streptomyces acidiscabies TaxID=42234 RepID=A0A0L0JX56_9ACTN|nr:HAD-IIIC family phosphatase [Streptomyces acidiscabies]KND30131.1 FkbH [Streptomyces acidiscabies]